MRAVRRILTGAVGAALALSLSLPGAVSAAPPSNDAYASATGVVSFPFDETVDMWEATFEPGEGATCENAYHMDRSVWYRVEAPDSTMRIWLAGESGSTTAAVYGPFDGAPADVTALGDPLWCVNGTGDWQALVEHFTAGTYLVQLTVAPWAAMYPSIHIDSADLHAPELGVTSVALRAKGVALEVTLEFLCWPFFDQTDFDSESGSIRISQNVGGRLIARGESGLWGTYHCDGVSPNTITRTIVTETVPFKRGVALIEGHIWLENFGRTEIHEELRLR